MPLDDFRHWTREVLATVPSLNDGPQHRVTGLWFVTGHQPQLFHPGVWVKQWAVAELAHQQTGQGWNWIIDNDLCPARSLLVPQARPDDSPIVGAIPWDEPATTQPWEETTLRDPHHFESFAQRVTAVWEPTESLPVLAEVWPTAIAEWRRSGDLIAALAAPRLAWEGRQQQSRGQVANRDVPLSQLCETDPFRRFAVHLLETAESFRVEHNRALGDYRRRHRLRSRSHPVPDLQAIDGRIEVPLWIWKAGESRRGRVFVGRRGPELVVDSGSPGAVVVRIPSGQPEIAVKKLREMSDAGYRLRPRALSTTLFARLCVADLFIHGIGGAHYDELTDTLFRRLFEIEPPAFLTLSATLRLPCAKAVTDVNSARKQLRTLQFHGERFTTATAGELVRQKQRLIAEIQRVASLPKAERRLERRRKNLAQQSRALNAQLRQELADRLTSLRQQVDRAEIENARVAPLRSREFSWILQTDAALTALYEALRARLDDRRYSPLGQN